MKSKQIKQNPSKIPIEVEQVKPGFTNYLPRGLAQKIESFNQKFSKWKKHLQNYSKMSKISEKCGEILTVEKYFKNILNCKKIK